METFEKSHSEEYFEKIAGITIYEHANHLSKINQTILETIYELVRAKKISPEALTIIENNMRAYYIKHFPHLVQTTFDQDYPQI